MNTAQLIELLAGGPIVGALYGVIAACFVLVYKGNRATNLVDDELVLVGTWACWWLVTAHNLPFWIGFIVCLVFMALLCMTMQKVALRPLMGPPVVSVVVATIGLTQFFQALLKWTFGASTKPVPPLFANQSVNLFGLDIETPSLLSLVCSIVVAAGLAYFFQFTKSGLAIRAPASDPPAAPHPSSSVRRVFALSWGIAAIVSALSAVVAGSIARVPVAVEPTGIMLFPAVIAGGLESMTAVVLGGVAIGLLEGLARFFNAEYLRVGNLMNVAPFYALLLILLVKPFRLFVSKDSERG
ncbi:MAG: branched-chain amino acid ABC transporter permease [Burkholderiales bacterium]